MHTVENGLENHHKKHGSFIPTETLKIPVKEGKISRKNKDFFSGQVRPRQGTEICDFGAPSPLEALHWIFCFFSRIYVQFSKTSSLKSGESSEKSSGENRVKSCHVCGCHGFFGTDLRKEKKQGIPPPKKKRKGRTGWGGGRWPPLSRLNAIPDLLSRVLFSFLPPLLATPLPLGGIVSCDAAAIRIRIRIVRCQRPAKHQKPCETQARFLPPLLLVGSKGLVLKVPKRGQSHAAIRVTI